MKLIFDVARNARSPFFVKVDNGTNDTGIKAQRLM